MNNEEVLVKCEDLSFAWWNSDAPEDPKERTLEDLNIVWDGLNLELPQGLVSVLGPNGLGKSTLLLLMAGRLFPHKGRVLIKGFDTKDYMQAPENPELELQRNLQVSVIYQNMELETEENLGSLLENSYSSGAWSTRELPSDFVLKDLPETICKGLELEGLKSKKLQHLSKGDLQRALIALAAAYGSPFMVMDEPCFAMEDRHKDLSFSWLEDHCRRSNTSLYFSAHDIDLCKSYSDYMLLIHSDKTLQFGPSEQVCVRKNLEEAYKAPLDTLYQRQHLYRDLLVKSAEK